MFNQVSLIGVGLIGGSLGLEIKRKKLARKVVGFGRTLKNLRLAKKRRLIDEIALTLPQAVKNADLILLCTPVETIEKNFRVVAEKASAGALVMDVGSTKAKVVKKASSYFGLSANFVGAHPLAGTEKGGAGAAEKDLFRGKKCLLTPTKKTSRKALLKAKKFWSALGSEVFLYSPLQHDFLLGATSHLPHMAAFSLMRVIGSSLKIPEIKRLSGGGLLDTTRIAASPAEMWRDISLSNSKVLSRLMKRYGRELKKLERLVRQKKGASLHRYFQKTSHLRKSLV